MQKSLSIAARAALALVLMVGFYALALGIAGGLLGLAYLDATTGAYIHVKLVLVCVVFAGVIVWSIVPRPDRFEAPGPGLTEDEQPALFAELRSVADATGQAMPREVYLVPEMNAFVAQRGGLMGLGSRRVMGIGLPLLQSVTVSQLRAILAHEFGHFHGGDTKLGPWVYKTRGAIGRTIVSLHEAGSFVHKPFEWYGNLFLRVTHAVSRRQEHAADALAARTVGPGHLAGGLRAVAGGALAFDAYWSHEYVPVLDGGHRPPLASGFHRFLRHETLAQKIDDAVAEEIAEGRADPYDTHPPLRDRLAALEGLEHEDEKADDRLAIELVAELAALERRLLASIANAEVVAELAEIDWADVGACVYAQRWREQAAAIADELEELTPATIPCDRETLAAIGREVLGPHALDHDEEAIAGFGGSHLAAAIAVALLDQGWEVSALPGDPVELRGDGVAVRPFKAIAELGSGELSVEEWRATCEAAGIADLDLGSLAVSAEPGP